METLQTGQVQPASAPSALPTRARTSVAQPPVRPQPTAPGSLAPDPATAAPTIVQTATPPPPSATPAATALPPLVLPTTPRLSNEGRWRAQQQDRLVFDALTPYTTTGSELWWFDPVNQQSVILGRVTGDVVAQAQFQLRGQGVTALEIPYQVNSSYGLTALSPALLGRIAAAGYESDWIETYIFLTPNVSSR